MAENRDPAATTLRRLRGRDVVVQPPTLAIGRQKQQHALTRKKSVRVAPSKRSSVVAGMDENDENRAPGAPSAKKRAALAEISNASMHCNDGRRVPQAGGAGAAPPLKTAAFKARNTAQAFQPRKNADNTALQLYCDEEVLEGDENARPIASTVYPRHQLLATASTLTADDVHSVKSKANALQEPAADEGLYAPAKHVEIEELIASKGYTDIDNNTDLLLCSSYASEIVNNLRFAELKRRPRTDFMEKIQQSITADMRGILVDWLVEVSDEYKLFPETLYLTVSFIDRYLSAIAIGRQQLQLLGVACMLVASKYEEPFAPQVNEFCYITDNTYNRVQVLQMEVQILNHFHFELSVPTARSFLKRFIQAAQADFKTPSLQLEPLGSYLAELTLLEYAFLRYLPSMIAASAVLMAKVTVDPVSKPWNATLVHYTGYKASELKHCVLAIHKLQINTKCCTLPAIRSKYKQHKFKCVATLTPPNPIPEHYFLDDSISVK